MAQPDTTAPEPAELGSSRERILAAALAAFSELGFDGATTREIATRADVNLGLINYYFEGKERLWQEAVDRAFGQLRDALGDAVREAGDFAERERIELLIRRYVHFVGAHPEFVRLMHEEGKREGPRMRWLVDRHVKPLFDTISAGVERAQAEGHMSLALSPLHFHYIFAGSVGLIFHQAAECRRLTGRDPADPDVVEAHADAVVQLLLGPPAKETR